jgi:putative phage-type endonuclease
MSVASIGLSDEALDERRKGIGASDVAGILGVDPWRSPWDVWSDKRGLVEPWKGNEATKIGQYLERAVIDYAEAELGSLARNVRVPYLGGHPVVATLDALTEDGNPVEIKTAGMTGPLAPYWGDAGTDQIPEHYLCQVHTQLLCTGADMAFLYALLGGRGIVRYEIPRHDDLCETLANTLLEWWDRHIVHGEEPSREKASLDIVKRFRRVPEKVVDLGDDLNVLLATRESLAAEAKAIKERQEECDKQLLLALGDAEVGMFADGTKVSYLEQHRKGYTVEPSSYRVLRIAKAKVKK